MMMYQELNDKQKKYVRCLFVAVFLFLAAFLAVYALYYGALAVETWKDVKDMNKFQITVSGEGSVFAVPDIAVLSIGVRSQAATLEKAQSDNTEKYNAVVAFIKSNGVEAKDIKTSSYYVNPQYQYDTQPCPYNANFPCPPNDPPKIAGYEVSATLQVKVRKVDSVGTILDGTVAAGANEVNGPQFTIDDESKLQEDAKRIAIQDAEEAARRLSKDLGVRLVRIIGFSEGGGMYPIMYDRAMEAYGKGGGISPAPTMIEPGENEVKVNVSVTYEVR